MDFVFQKDIGKFQGGRGALLFVYQRQASFLYLGCLKLFFLFFNIHFDILLLELSQNPLILMKSSNDFGVVASIFSDL